MPVSGLELEQCSNRRWFLVPDESGHRFAWHTYQKPAPEKWSWFSVPDSGLCVMGIRFPVTFVNWMPKSTINLPITSPWRAKRLDIIDVVYHFIDHLVGSWSASSAIPVRNIVHLWRILLRNLISPVSCQPHYLVSFSTERLVQRRI